MTRDTLRVGLLARGYSPPFDEGVKVLLKNLKETLERAEGVEALDLVGETLFNRRVLKLVRRPLDYLIYVPVQAATFNSLLKARLIALWSRSKVVLVSVQMRSYGPGRRGLVSLLQPHMIFVQSRRAAEAMAAFGFRRIAINGWGVDLDKFRPVGPEEKARLRARHGIPADLRVYLHFGHLQPGRNVAELATLARHPGVLALLVCSTTTPRARALQATLEAAGVRLITDFVPENQELYQLADYYVFPTETDRSAIEFPLSVLEALACGLPVFHKNFGALADFGHSVYGNLRPYVHPDELLTPTFTADHPFPIGSFSWDHVLRDLLAQIVQNDA